MVVVINANVICCRGLTSEEIRQHKNCRKAVVRNKKKIFLDQYSRFIKSNSITVLVFFDIFARDEVRV